MEMSYAIKHHKRYFKQVEKWVSEDIVRITKFIDVTKDINSFNVESAIKKMGAANEIHGIVKASYDVKKGTVLNKKKVVEKLINFFTEKVEYLESQEPSAEIMEYYKALFIENDWEDDKPRDGVPQHIINDFKALEEKQDNAIGDEYYKLFISEYPLKEYFTEYVDSFEI